jgi:hypothetical protein
MRDSASLHPRGDAEPSVRVRALAPEDVPALLGLIDALADY